jgi:hypothetical protein
MGALKWNHATFVTAPSCRPHEFVSDDSQLKVDSTCEAFGLLRTQRDLDRQMDSELTMARGSRLALISSAGDWTVEVSPAKVAKRGTRSDMTALDDKRRELPFLGNPVDRARAVQR